MASVPRTVLGISLGHGDSSAALVRDGKLVAAVEEERFTRIKHCALFPSHAIAYCLHHAGVGPAEVEVIAVARKPWAAWKQKLALSLRHPSLFSLGRHRSEGESPQNHMKKQLDESGLSRARLVRVEHHLAHLMSARYLSDSDNIAFLSFDGLGDFVSTAIGRNAGLEVEVLDRLYFPHSLGFFYTAMTHYLGFPYFGDEFKVMGLSSYGKPKYLPALRELIRENTGFGFRLNLEAFPLLSKPMGFRIENGQPYLDSFYQSNFLTHGLGIIPRKKTDPLLSVHHDLAKSVQARFEEIANHLLIQLHEKVKTDTLALAGGCAHNSVWVGKIADNTPFKKIFVAPASHDAGIAVGAAIHAARTKVTPEGMHWGLLGPSLSEVSDSPAELPSHVQTMECPNEPELIHWIVEELCQGKILGLFQGRMEFGPRALGSRSILADPRKAYMKDRLNERVKHRETFRPFAASVLWEYQENWFERSFFAPTMEAVFEVKPDMAKRIPAVVHADQSCRIQSVTKETQPFYWNLIEAFRKKTGVPMLVNTSFNDSEPIVCTERNALECFLHSDLDHLVIESKIFTKSSQKLALAS